MLLDSAVAQQVPQVPSPPDVHYMWNDATPPGQIGHFQLMRGGPLHGYFQPVEFKAPSGAKIAIAANGVFGPGESTLAAGLLIGQVYRLKITEIPGDEGREVYPTIELIDRIYPPNGFPGYFPIRVEVNLDDLRQALAGRYVTRVTYLENPEWALPYNDRPDAQSWFQVAPGQSAIHVADCLGRPVAVMRLGSRQPTSTAQPDMQFLFGCPQFLPLVHRTRELVQGEPGSGDPQHFLRQGIPLQQPQPGQPGVPPGVPQPGVPQPGGVQPQPGFGQPGFGQPQPDDRSAQNLPWRGLPQTQPIQRASYNGGMLP